MQSVKTISESQEKFLTFRFRTGFSEGKRPQSFVVDSEIPEEKTEAEKETPATPSSTPVPKIDFKGWPSKNGKTASADRKRALKSFSTFCDVVGGVPVISGMCEENSSVDSLQMVIELHELGLVTGMMDLMIKQSPHLRSSPVHAGPTMFDDVAAAVDFIKSLPETTDDKDMVFNSLFVKTVMCSILRERPFPVYITDMTTFAVRSMVTKSVRGSPIVTYEVLSISAFEADLKRWSDKSSTGHRAKGSPPSCQEAIKRLLKVDTSKKRMLENGVYETHVHEVPTLNGKVTPAKTETATPRAAKSKTKPPSKTTVEVVAESPPAEVVSSKKQKVEVPVKVPVSSDSDSD